MLTTSLTPLDYWIAERIGASPSGPPLAPETLERWQEAKRAALIQRIRAHSPFYRSRLPDVPGGACSREEWAALPLTTADDLRLHGPDMLCVSHAEVARATTLPTTGTTGQPKRIWFTDADLERTVDFFHHGMSTFTRPGQRVLVCMPGEDPASIGGLLRQAMPRMHAQAVVHGLATDPEAALRAVRDAKADVLVALPVQALAMARHPRSALGQRLSAVLLSADHVSQALRQAVERAFGCPVYAHWGMTETGYGGGVECGARHGYHLRGADLFVEIIDPVSGRIMPDGVPGEVVISTLTAQALPLLRYRTGDLASLLQEPCPCGCRLPRLGPVLGRLRDRVNLDDGTTLSMAALDDALLVLPWLINFQAAAHRKNGSWILDLEILPALTASMEKTPTAARDAVRTALTAAGLLGDGRLRLGVTSLGAPLDRLNGPLKRALRYGRHPEHLRQP